MVLKLFSGVIRGSPRLILKNNALSLSVIVFSPKVLIADTIFLCLQLETGPPFNMVIRATQFKSTRLHCNGLEYLHFLVILRP